MIISKGIASEGYSPTAMKQLNKRNQKTSPRRINYWEGRIIHWELCKPESCLVNYVHNVLKTSMLKTDPLNKARRLDLVLIRKNIIFPLVDFVVPPYYTVKFNEGKKFDKYMNLARELKQFSNIMIDCDTSRNS